MESTEAPMAAQKEASVAAGREGAAAETLVMAEVLDRAVKTAEAVAAAMVAVEEVAAMAAIATAAVRMAAAREAADAWEEAAAMARVDP